MIDGRVSSQSGKGKGPAKAAPAKAPVVSPYSGGTAQGRANLDKAVTANKAKSAESAKRNAVPTRTNASGLKAPTVSPYSGGTTQGRKDLDAYVAQKAGKGPASTTAAKSAPAVRSGSADSMAANAPGASQARQGRASGTATIQMSAKGGAVPDLGYKPKGYRGTSADYAMNTFEQKPGMSAGDIRNTTIGRGWTLAGRQATTSNAGRSTLGGGGKAQQNLDYSNLPGDTGFNSATSRPSLGPVKSGWQPTSSQQVSGTPQVAAAAGKTPTGNLATLPGTLQPANALTAFNSSGSTGQFGVQRRRDQGL